MSAIIIDNYWGVGFSIFALLVASFAFGSVHGYEVRMREVRRERMSREWGERQARLDVDRVVSMYYHPTNNKGEQK